MLRPCVPTVAMPFGPLVTYFEEKSMAMCTTEDGVPDPGDVVKSLEWSKDREMVWITFESGKVVVVHVM